ncbi:MAG: UbiA family prenyltransferase [Planctomycetes bacterium]|nr:UbiA family prenyltransferase [Planctomycetota bacterium]
MSASRALAWAKLLRVSNAPTIPVDLLAGYAAARALGATELLEPVSFGGTLAACLGIYLGALVLNDRLDLAHDAATRPQRPLPSGAVSARAATLAYLALFALAVLGALFAPPRVRIPLALLALVATGYDLYLKRSPLLGPAALGLCRALDLGIGMLLAGAPESVLPAAAILLCYAGYVVSLSGLARMEDGEPRLVSIRAALLGAGACFAAGPLSLGLELAALPALPIALWIATRGFAGASEWPRERVGRTVGRLLGLLALFGACVAFAGDAVAIALVALLLFGLARALARCIPPS